MAELTTISSTPQAASSPRDARMDEVRLRLLSLDHNKDGMLTRAEIERSTRLSQKADDIVIAAWEAIAQHNSGLPKQAEKHWLRVDDQNIFSRATLIDHLMDDSTVAGVKRRDIDHAIASVFPGGIADIKLSEACESRAALSCFPLKGKVMIFDDSGRNA